MSRSGYKIIGCVLGLCFVAFAYPYLIEGNETKGPTNTSVISSDAMDDLNKAKEEIKAKQKELEDKEIELKTREKTVAEEMKKLEVLRDEIAKTQEERKQEKQAKVTKLIQTYLTMSPKSVAKVLSALDDDLAVAVMNQMETQSLAKIMNLMDPKRSSLLSELMAGLKKKKGGEISDHNQQQLSSASGSRQSNSQPDAK